MKKVFLPLIALALASLACSLVSAGTGGGGSSQPVITQPVSNQPVSTQSVATQPASNNTVLFSDDFSDTSSGWDSFTSTDGLVTTDYANGGYRVFVNKPKYLAWANPGKSFDGDVIVAADVTKTGGPEDNEFGLICRYKDENNFYVFKASSDGFAQIGKYSGGNFTGLTGDQMEQVSGINAGSTLNHLEADCVGDTLTLYVNNNKVMTTTDSELASGDVGVYAGTFDTAGTDVLFHNFLVTKP